MHSTVYPVILNRNISVFAGGFTATTFFSFHPTHLLHDRIAILGSQFKKYASQEEILDYESTLAATDYKVETTYTGCRDKPSPDCPRLCRRVNKLEATVVYSWELQENSGISQVHRSMLQTDFTWMNGARCLTCSL